MRTLFERKNALFIHHYFIEIIGSPKDPSRTEPTTTYEKFKSFIEQMPSDRSCALTKEVASLKTSGAVNAEVLKNQKSEASKQLMDLKREKKNLDSRLTELESEAAKRALDLGRYRARVKELEQEIQLVRRIHREELMENRKLKKTHEEANKTLDKENKALKKKLETLEARDREHEAKMEELKLKKIKIQADEQLTT